MKIYICNAFSLSMLDRSTQTADPRFGTVIAGMVKFPRVPRPIEDPERFIIEAQRADAEIISALGHASMQGIFEKILGVDCPVNRVNVHLTTGRHALVGQYIGPPIEKRATELPDGAVIEWWLI